MVRTPSVRRAARGAGVVQGRAHVRIVRRRQAGPYIFVIVNPGVDDAGSMLLALAILTFFVATAMMHLFHDAYDEVYGGMCRTSGFSDPTLDATLNSSKIADLHSPACANKPRHHFDNIAISYITVFQVMTTDNWLAIMWDTYATRLGMEPHHPP